MSNGARWKYVPPNVVTCLGLLLGLLSIAASLRGSSLAAGWFVIMGVLVDKLDGTLARRLNASSEFGEQMDSLADLVTFGVAPTVMFLAVLGGSPAISEGVGGWFPIYAYSLVFLFTIGGALRLARFNVLTSTYGNQYFYGTPVPMSAALLVSVIMVLEKHGVGAEWFRWVPVLYGVMAFMMVSRVPIPKLKPLENPALNALQAINVVVVYLMGFTWFVVPTEWLFPEYLMGIVLVYFSFGASWSYAKGVRAPRG